MSNTECSASHAEAAAAGKIAHEERLSMTVDIVSAYVSNNQVEASNLSAVIEEVYASLGKLSDTQAPEPVALVPAVPIRSSVKPDFIVCLEDGKKLKMLKRYISSRYNLTPDQYRQRWGLPQDYPMVAPNYAARRSDLAKQIGLGMQGRKKSK